MGFGEARTEAGRQVQRCCPSPTMGNSSPGCQPSDKTCDPLWLLQPALRGQEALADLAMSANQSATSTLKNVMGLSQKLLNTSTDLSRVNATLCAVGPKERSSDVTRD